MTKDTAIRNPQSLTHALEHHGKKLVEMVGVLSLGILTKLQPLGWVLKQSGEGANSFSLQRGHEQFHFRYDRSPGSRKIDTIIVKDAYRNGKVIDTLTGRVDALRFINKVAAK